MSINQQVFQKGKSKLDNLIGTKKKNLVIVVVFDTLVSPLTLKIYLLKPNNLCHYNTCNKNDSNFFFLPTCHYCGVFSHIHPMCYKLKYDMNTGRRVKWS